MKKIRYRQLDSKTSTLQTICSVELQWIKCRPPLSDYMHNPVYQELISEDDYFDVTSDERLYLDLRASSGYVKEAEKLEMNDLKISLRILLKKAATKN